jgi:hypothetical protein
MSAELTRRDKARRLGIALLVVACVAGLAFAVQATREIDAQGDAIVERADPCEVLISGDEVDAPACDPDRESLGPVVEQLFPAADSEALQQVQVGVDLGSRFTGVLVVDGIEVPESQLVRQDALNQVFFSPGDDQVIDEWEPGRNCVRAIVWPITEGRTASRNIDWCFEVT